MKTLVLGHDAIACVLEKIGPDALMDQMIERLEEALRCVPPGLGALPVREGFVLPSTGSIEWMPYHHCGRDVTIKVVSHAPHNPRGQGMPTILATITRHDADSGSLKVLCDGVLATAMRTGAASAIATRHLAAPHAEIVGMVGAGAQAVTQLHALSRVLPLQECLVYDIDPEAAGSLAERVPVAGLSIRAVSLAELLARSDVICTATSVGVGAGPVIQDEGLRPHVHINAVGGDFPGRVEIPRTLLRRALLCPDMTAQALRDGESQQVETDHLGPDLFELARDPHTYSSWRHRPTIFDSTGTALEDHVALDVLLEAAETCEVGDLLDIEAWPTDALNPYATSVHTAEDSLGGRPR